MFTPAPIQLGFPELLEAGSPAFFKLLKLWLEDCNEKHSNICRGTDQNTLPTRLIDVGSTDLPQLRVIETQETQPKDRCYLALSHPWGDASRFPPFSAYKYDTKGQGRDIDTLKRAIPYDDLPATFKHAVVCTRALGVRYLWIDSICILQGKDGDFGEEAKHMEEVFSGAYCVLAASRATSQHDGFIGFRPKRKFISMKQGTEPPFYICEPIDEFSRDVIEGSLNQRGWVLQERALARRTIYFTENQTYFECGNGIRCETMVAMRK